MELGRLPAHTVESFHSTQRKWAIAGLIVYGVVILLSILAAAAGG